MPEPEKDSKEIRSSARKRLVVTALATLGSTFMTIAEATKAFLDLIPTPPGVIRVGNPPDVFIDGVSAFIYAALTIALVKSLFPTDFFKK